MVSPGVHQFTKEAIRHLADAHNAIIEACVFQTHWSNVCCRDEPGRTTKLLPKFVGPYPVTGVVDGKSVYKLGLPTELTKQGIYNNFHASLLRPHYPNDDDMFPSRSMVEPYDFSEPVNVEWVVDNIIGHQWDG
ncbi:hypothetical protein GYMLUDRAFT_182363 [Collybiopsis luxurians FD-317 M1]|uniref:Tf2-1-like SH3-like domain-containing protein n=1 Tax=Collybiopsis luxurians FD-317 M1 TaxID=944289 RepID=A0A0D0C7I2_9AGAR|nr:hypothetical protein GYMLUDRAFT_182363 [Collybiopsis luxurians FD-317 M1]